MARFVLKMDGQDDTFFEADRLSINLRAQAFELRKGGDDGELVACIGIGPGVRFFQEAALASPSGLNI